jgi:hypothetical protein
VSSLGGNRAPSLRDRHHLEGDRIDLTNQAVVEVWTRSLGITPDELRRAVQAVGSEVGPVYDYVKRAKQSRA